MASVKVGYDHFIIFYNDSVLLFIIISQKLIKGNNTLYFLCLQLVLEMGPWGKKGGTLPGLDDCECVCMCVCVGRSRHNSAESIYKAGYRDLGSLALATSRK